MTPDRPLRHNAHTPVRELGPVFVQLHDGPSGTDGMDNRLDMPRAQADAAEAYWDSYGLNAIDVTAQWRDVTIQGVIREHSVWNEPAGGRLLATGRCNPPAPIYGTPDHPAYVYLSSFPMESV
jgi:hypothetical protein